MRQVKNSYMTWIKWPTHIQRPDQLSHLGYINFFSSIVHFIKEKDTEWWKMTPHLQAYLFYCVSQITVFFTNCWFVAILCRASLAMPLFQWNLLTLCLCVTFWYFSEYFKLFHYYYVCHGDLWSVSLRLLLWLFWGAAKSTPL